MAGQSEPRAGSATATMRERRTALLATVARYESAADAERITGELEARGYAAGAAGAWSATVRRDGKIALRHGHAVNYVRGGE